MINIILGACDDDDENTTQYTDDDPNLSLWHFINLFFECVQFIYRAFERSVWTNHSYDASIFLLLSVFFFSLGGEEKNTTINRRRERDTTQLSVSVIWNNNCVVHLTMPTHLRNEEQIVVFFPQFGLHLVLMLRWNNSNKFANGKTQWKWSRGGTTWSYFIAMLPLNKWHFRFYSNSFRKTHNSTRISLYNNDERHYVWSSDLNLNVIRPKSTESAMEFSLEAIFSQRFELCEFDWRSVML